MVICEKKTNVKEVCYSSWGHMPFPMVRYKGTADYFFSADSLLIHVGEDDICDAYKVFQYECCKANEATLSYSIYEFVNCRKKQYVVRIVEWDRTIAKKAIVETPEESELELESAIYYLSGELSAKMKSLLRRIRNHFKKEPSFVKADTTILNSNVYIGYNGFSKTIQWGAPMAEQTTEAFLDKVVAEIIMFAEQVGSKSIPRVEVLYPIDPYEYERIVFGVPNNT